MVHLQQMHEAHAKDGLVLLGMNTADDEAVAKELLEQAGVTYRQILDGSDAALKTASRDYRTSGVPVNFIIDRDGVITAAWYGWRKGDTRATEVLAKLGIGGR